MLAECADDVKCAKTRCVYNVNCIRIVLKLFLRMGLLHSFGAAIFRASGGGAMQLYPHSSRNSFATSMRIISENSGPTSCSPIGSPDFSPSPAGKTVLGRKHVFVNADLRKTHLFLSAFPMFVPSLSW